jgi:transposase
VAEAVPHGHWQMTTTVAAIRLAGVAAALVFEGATDAAAFETYVEGVLVPALRPGDVVLLDNLSSHKGARVVSLIEAAGARVVFLPPYSPDFNPIEKMWSKVKAALRAAGARTKEALWEAIGQALRAVTAADCAGFFASCGIPATTT